MSAPVVRPAPMSREVEVVVPPAALLDVLVHIGQEMFDGLESGTVEALRYLVEAQHALDDLPAGSAYDRRYDQYWCDRTEALAAIAALIGPVVWRMPADHARDLGSRLVDAGWDALGYHKCGNGPCEALVHNRDATEGGCCSADCEADTLERQGTPS